MEEAALHQRLLRRDPSVVADLVAAFSGPMYHLAQMILGQVGAAEDAEEAVSDAIAAAWERTAEFDPDRTSLKSWLLMLTKYAALDRRRQLVRQRYLPSGEARVAPISTAPEPVAPSSPEDELLRADQREQLHRGLARLAEPDRELLIRRYFFEEPIAEIAQGMGLTRGALDNRLWRARQALKALLNHEMEGTRHGTSAI